MDILSDDKYMELIKKLSTYESRVVEDKIYELPKYSLHIINELYIQGTPEGFDICDMILFFNYYMEKDKRTQKKII